MEYIPDAAQREEFGLNSFQRRFPTHLTTILYFSLQKKSYITQRRLSFLTTTTTRRRPRNIAVQGLTYSVSRRIAFFLILQVAILVRNVHYLLDSTSRHRKHISCNTAGRMFGLPLPLVLLLWPLSMTFAQSLTTPSASLSSISLASLTSSRSLAPSASSSGSANASLSASATSSASFPSLSGYSPCVVQCLGLSISQVGCNSIVDVQCFCTNATRFSRAIVNCVSSECPTDLTAAESVSQQFCNVASPNVSLSFPSPTASQTSDPSSSRPSSSQSLTSSPASSSGSSQSSSSASSSSPSTSQSDTSGAIGTFGQAPALGMAIVSGWCLAVLGWVTMW